MHTSTEEHRVTKTKTVCKCVYVVGETIAEKGEIRSNSIVAHVNKSFLFH